MTRLIQRCLGIIACLALAGCAEDEIRHYQTVRLEQPKRPEPHAHTHGGDARMLAAIVPRGEQTWFFKLVGPVEEVDPAAAEFDRFIESIRFDASDQITWTVPDGWKQLPGSASRFATLQLGPEDHRIDLTVVPLGRESGTLLANVNRWRGQLGLEPAEESELGSMTRELKGADWTATIVDLRTSVAQLPAGHPPVSPAMSGAPAAGDPAPRPAGPLQYDIPTGWRQVPASGGFRVAAFTAGSGDRQADVAVTPLAGAAGGLLQNINRWRSQIELPPVDNAELRTQLRPIEVAGSEASFVELIGPESAAEKRMAILGVIVEHGGQTWFFKMTGPAGVVAEQKEAFESFARSVRFGSPSGN